MKKLTKWLIKIFEGHLNIGPITIHGRNAMHWGVTIRSKKYGYICFRLPFRCYGKWWSLYWYCSPNATPWAATFMLGHKHDPDWALSRIRKRVFGHGVDLDEMLPDYNCTNGDILRAINSSVGTHKTSYCVAANQYRSQCIQYCENDALLTQQLYYAHILEGMNNGTIPVCHELSKYINRKESNI